MRVVARAVMGACFAAYSFIMYLVIFTRACKPSQFSSMLRLRAARNCLFVGALPI
jgi:hypothetical protein